MTVSELAKSVGVNPQTVRYYERIKLLDKPARLASGYRDYNQSAQRRLQFILAAKEIGFTLAEIVDLLGLDTDSPASCDRVQRIAVARLAELDKKLATIRRIKKTLKRVTAFCAENQTDAPCPVLEILEG